MDEIHIFVDNSNVFYEGQRASNVRLGRSASQLDKSFIIDYGKLLYVIQEKDSRIPAQMPMMYGSEPPPRDTVWKRIEREGFDVQVFKKNFFGKEKRVDMTMGLDMQKLALTAEQPGTCCIVAGDDDYVPVVEVLQNHSWTVEVWFWDNVAGNLKEAADRFESLNPHIDFLGTRPPRR